MVEVRRASTLLLVRPKQSYPQELDALSTIDFQNWNIQTSENHWINIVAEQLRNGSNSRTWNFYDNFQVLWGQSEVVNWVKSESEDNLQIMSYAGEFKLPGGSQDVGESLIQTAIRETEEEMLIKIPDNAVIRPFRRVRTKVIRGRAFEMYNFVAFEDENLWMKSLDIDQINLQLKEKRDNFFLMKSTTPEFWTNWRETNLREREKLSPEVKQVCWLDLESSIVNCFSSKANDLIPVNDFQKIEFEKLGIKKRDPMMATLFVLVELALRKDLKTLVDFCNTVSFQENFKNPKPPL